MAVRQRLARLFNDWAEESLPSLTAQAAAEPWIELLAEEMAASLANLPNMLLSRKVRAVKTLEFWRPVRVAIERQLPGINWNLLNEDGAKSFSVSAESAGPQDEAAAIEASPPLSLGATRGAPAPDLPVDKSKSAKTIVRAARISAITIRNFKAVAEIDALKIRSQGVDIPSRYGLNESTQTGVGWTVLLGENGSGKSCCLQALGLALAGDRLDDLMASSGLRWEKLLRRGADQGQIVLDFSDGARAHLQFNAEKHWWPDGAPKMDGFVRGYGATRLLDRELETEDGANVRLANLFDAKAPVLDAERWLLDIEDEGDFNAGALTLAEFLGAESIEINAPSRDVESEPYIQRDDDRTEVTAGGDPLGYASDGYRAVVALVCDIMAGLGVGFSDLRNAPGIVLIDEIGAHLHPRWKMEITTRLRREFPQIQFFASTHEPLCLRGLRESEVIRVRKERPEGAAKTGFTGRVTLEVIERSPSDFRIDQLLTSEFFGLDATIDPDLDRRFQAYYRLLAMDEKDRKAKTLPWNPKKTLQDELEDLREYLEDRAKPALGTTRRDRLAYEAIDKYLSEEESLAPDKRRTERARVIEKLQELWKPPKSLLDLPKDS